MSDPTQGWTPVRKVRAHEQVMAQIEQRILDGELAAGDHLPNERDLSAMLGVTFAIGALPAKLWNTRERASDPKL